MDFFNSAIDVLQTLVIALGAGLGVWGVVNMLEGYGNDNPGAMTGCHTEDRPKCRMDEAQTKRLPKVSRVSSSLWLAAVSHLGATIGTIAIIRKVKANKAAVL